MSMTLLLPNDCLGAAQRDALRMHGNAAPTAWQPAVRHRWRAWVLAGLVLTLGATGAVLAAREFSSEPTTAQGRVAAAGLATTAPATLSPIRALAAPAPAAPAAAPREQRIERNGDLWLIDVAGLSREQAAQRLAVATGGVLLERPELLAQIRALTLSWRGADVGEAWRQLLGDEVGYALQCAAQACRVWVLAAVERNVAATPANQTAAATVSARDIQTTVEPPAAVSSAQTIATPMQPDPPGLFPSPPDAE